MTDDLQTNQNKRYWPRLSCYGAASEVRVYDAETMELKRTEPATLWYEERGKAYAHSPVHLRKKR